MGMELHFKDQANRYIDIPSLEHLKFGTTHQ